MKKFLWLLSTALGVLCGASWIIGEQVTNFMTFFRHGFTPPALAELLLHHTWLLFCPVPWIVYAAMLSRRRELSTDAVFVFAGTIGLAMVVIVCVVGAGAVLGCLPFAIGDPI
jgi:hypothetical protein